MTMSIHKAALAALACAALLAACGGGGGGGETVAAPSINPATPDQVPGTGVPTAATTSVGSVIAFLQQLIAGTSETSEPVALGNASLATSETDEPVARP